MVTGLLNDQIANLPCKVLSKDQRNIDKNDYKAYFTHIIQDIENLQSSTEFIQERIFAYL